MYCMLITEFINFTNILLKIVGYPKFKKFYQLKKLLSYFVYKYYVLRCKYLVVNKAPMRNLLFQFSFLNLYLIESVGDTDIYATDTYNLKVFGDDSPITLFITLKTPGKIIAINTIDMKSKYEDDEIIHFAEPGIRGEKWGTSLIDSLARYLALQIYGLKYNTSIFENNGINPRAVMNYDINIEYDDLLREIERLEKDRKENPDGVLIVQGAEYIQTQTSNKDMQYVELENLVRDITLSIYGVTPAEAGIIESGNLGGGTGQSQKETVKANLSGWVKLFEGAHNKVFGRSGFEELFEFKEMDLEDKEKRANIEDKKLRNGSTFVNEVRAGYGLDPVDWGETPLTYGNTNNTLQDANLESESQKQLQTYRKALLLERIKAEY